MKRMSARSLRPRSSRINPLQINKSARPSDPRQLKNRPASTTPPHKWWEIWKWRPHRPHLTWKKALIIFGATLAVIVVGIAGVFAYYVGDLPNPKELSVIPVQSTKILDRNGKLLYSFYDGENRTVLKPEEISDYSKKATVAVEDANFYSHPGFDVKGLTRAVYCRATSSCVGGGGSTITQQYIKNALLTRDQTLDRKLRELILAIETEQRYSKEEILTGYLNNIPYGGSVYGIEAAAQTYYNKPAKDLTLSEAAILAAIPQRPSYFSPYGNNLDALFRRKDYVLDRMVKTGSITQEEADAAKKDTPNAENPSFAKKSGIISPHFVFYVRQQLIDYIGGDPKEAEQKLDQAGYTVTTSLDLDTQTMAEGVMAELGPDAVKKYNASNAALTAVDPKTGEILAMVGSIDYYNSKSGNTNFANALLQPGSSFKPIVYATEFDPDHKKNPGSITFDVPMDFGNNYTPKNYDNRFRGPITNRNALAQSLNIPAVKNLYMATVDDSIATAQKLGITSLDGKASDYGLSLVLGSGEVRPVELANAYAAFANNGEHHPLRPILKIEQNNNVIKDYTTEAGTQAIEPQVAYQITSILSDNQARSPTFGTKNLLTLPDRTVAAKTGTTNRNRDAWTVGYTPQISVAVWVGNNEANKTMNSGGGGSMAAAPIWNKFMRNYLKDKPAENFVRPDGLKEVTIDFLSGKLPTDQSPADQRITELMADWQIPTTFDDVHVKVKVDKTTGLLATDLTPPENIEERTYFNVHSEEPDKPNWEDPVQAWARANGGASQPPTEKDNMHTEENRPTVSITNPKDGSSVNGTFSIEAAVGGTRTIQKVEFFMNNVSIGTATQAPWKIDFNPSSLSVGTQTIDVVATNDLGLTRTDQVIVTYTGSGTTVTPTATPDLPPNPVISPSAKAVPVGTVNFAWMNPSDSDLRSVHIYKSTTAGDLGNLVKTVSVTPGSQGSSNLTGLSIGTYYFTLRTVDTGDRENTSGAQLSVNVQL